MEEYKGWKEDDPVWVRIGKLWWPAFTCTTAHGNLSSIPKDQAFYAKMNNVFKRSQCDHRNWPKLQEMMKMTSGQRAAIAFLGPVGTSFLKLVNVAKQKSGQCSNRTPVPASVPSASVVSPPFVKTMVFGTPSRTSFWCPSASPSTRPSVCFESVTIVEFALGPVVDRIPDDLYPVGLWGPPVFTSSCSLREVLEESPRIFATVDRANLIPEVERKEMWRTQPELDREELAQVRKSRSSVGCNCRTVRGKDACSSQSCSCFANLIGCSVSQFGCGCLAESCINPKGRYQYDSVSTGQLIRESLIRVQPNGIVSSAVSNSVVGKVCEKSPPTMSSDPIVPLDKSNGKRKNMDDAVSCRTPVSVENRAERKCVKVKRKHAGALRRQA